MSGLTLAVPPMSLPPPFCSIILDSVYVPARVRPIAIRLFTTSCAELYQMRPSLRSNIVILVNSGNGRLNSYRDSVGLVNRAVPSKPGTWKNGLGSSSLQNATLPPFVGSHLSRSDTGGSLKPPHRFCSCRVRLPTYESSTVVRPGNWRCTPSENWCTYGLTKSVFEKPGPRPRNVCRPSDDPGAGATPCENGFASENVDVRPTSSDAMSGVEMPKPFDVEM